MERYKNKESVLIIYDQNMVGGDSSFIKHIRKKYPNCHMIYMFTNIARISAASINGYLNDLKGWYDIVCAFDPKDAIKYGFEYCPLIYDKTCIESNENENCVFYLGLAKDRLEMLIDVFHKIDEMGVKTDFNIVNVDEKYQKFGDKIKYNKRMSYREALNHIAKSTCLIDVIQGESEGLTIKTCEAVAYKKKLITTNKHVKDYPFYDSRYIRIIESPDDITDSFFEENKKVEYPADGRDYFSSERFLERIEELLKNE